MDYEYDDDKSEWTFRERQIDFEFAARVFDSDYIEYEDRRRDYGEKRFLVIGPIAGRLFAVIYTWRGGRRRIISADGPVGERRAYHRRSRNVMRGLAASTAAVDATTEADIARQIAEDPDTAPELTEEALDRAVIVGADGTRTPYRDRVPRPQGARLLPPGSALRNRAFIRPSDRRAEAPARVPYRSLGATVFRQHPKQISVGRRSSPVDEMPTAERQQPTAPPPAAPRAHP